MTISKYDVKELKNEISNLYLGADNLENGFLKWFFWLKSTQKKYKSLRDDVSKEKQRISISPQIRESLEGIQLLEHQKTLGQFEILLEAILEDILPDRKFKVKLDLSVSHKVPSLDFYVSTHNGEWEDAWKYNGGAVADALSLGLRFISIFRSGQRRFILLDEADSWLEEDSVSKYVNVIDGLCKNFNLQALMISHHNDTLLQTSESVPVYHLIKDYDGIVKLELDAGKTLPVWEKDDVGIRSIHIKNLLSHSDTFLKLNQGLTVILGKNNIGKSVFREALNSISRNDFNDLMIKHNTKNAEIELEIENGFKINLKRFKKIEQGTKTIFELKDDLDQVLKMTKGGKQGEVPDWLESNLKLGLTDNLKELDLDPFLLSQKDRTFLLNKPKTHRASVLSIQMEDDIILNMFKLETKIVSELKSSVKFGEKELNKYFSSMKKLEEYDIHFNRHKDKELSRLISTKNDEIDDLLKLMNLLNDWNKKIKLVNLYQNFINETNNLESIKLDENIVDDIHVLNRELDLLYKWKYENDVSSIIKKYKLNLKDNIVIDFEFDETFFRTWIDNYISWKNSENLVKIYGDYLKETKNVSYNENLLNDLNDNIYILEKINSWCQLLEDKSSLSKSLLEIDKKIDNIAEEMSEFKVCPLCNSPMHTDTNHKSENNELSF